jgi:hypothetical protein
MLNKTVLDMRHIRKVFSALWRWMKSSFRTGAERLVRENDEAEAIEIQ